MEKLIMQISGMSCAHCRMAVMAALKSVSSVSEVAVDLKKGTATIAYDPAAVSRGELLPLLKQAVADAGYEAH